MDASFYAACSRRQAGSLPGISGGTTRGCEAPARASAGADVGLLPVTADLRRQMVLADQARRRGDRLWWRSLRPADPRVSSIRAVRVGGRAHRGTCVFEASGSERALHGAQRKSSPPRRCTLSDRAPPAHGRCDCWLRKAGSLDADGFSFCTFCSAPKAGSMLGNVANAVGWGDSCPKDGRWSMRWPGGAFRSGIEGWELLTFFPPNDQGFFCGVGGLWLLFSWGVGPSLSLNGPSRGVVSAGPAPGRSGHSSLILTVSNRALTQVTFASGHATAGGTEQAGDDESGVGDGHYLPTMGSAVPSRPAVSSEEGRPLVCRSSQRLASRDATPILLKAIARKARLEGGVGEAACDSTRIIAASIQKKSKLCGVSLDCGEANSLLEFAARKNV